ncbi:hypothetical protein NNRS527_03223 (plasmid) [Nitrosospira sp. NRS527]|nr:hypothetical protein NNRS527_03223 [Nitrosospira sp. NRS527]
MKRVVMLVLVLMLAGCGSLSMIPDSGTKLEKSPCACDYEAINHG